MSATTVAIPAPALFDQARLAVRRLPGPLLRAHPHRLHHRPAPVLRLVRRPGPRRVRCPAGAPRAVGPLHGGPRPGPGQGRSAPVHRLRLLPLRCRRRPASSLAGRVRPPPEDKHRVGHARPRPHGARRLHRLRGGREPHRSRPGLPARAVGPAGLRGVLDRRRGPRHGAGASDRHGGGQGIQAGRHPPAAANRPGAGPGRRRAAVRAAAVGPLWPAAEPPRGHADRPAARQARGDHQAPLPALLAPQLHHRLSRRERASTGRPDRRPPRRSPHHHSA